MLGSGCLFLFIVSALVSVLDSQSTGDGPGHDKAVVCYIATWAAYRTPPGDFQLGDLDPHVCTHLVYSFAGLNPNDYTIKVLDPWQDLPDGGGKAGYQRLVSLKKSYRHLKVTIAIGGWNEGSLQYSLMADSPEHRGRFVDSVVKFLQKHEFDGLDLDWEYPTKRDGRPQDKANYVTLVRQLKEAFRPHGFILTAALGVGKDTMDSAYDLPKLSQYLDLIHMMCYDYHGKWDGVVGPNAPLRGMNDNDTLSVEYSIQYMLRHGVIPSKLVLGLPMYGRTFLLTDPETRVVEFGRTPSVNGFAGPLTKEVGFMGYNEICREIYNKSSTWSIHWHRQSETPYIHDGNKVVTYDNERSIASKVKMAMEYGLGGVMVWSIDTDDFKGACGMKLKEAFVDFEVRAQQLAHDPLLKKALPNVRIPGISSERSSYVITGDKLELKIVEPKVSNYPLMRTINDATRLAIQEKKLLDAMNKITRHNEVEQHVPYKKPGGGASGFNGSFLLVVIGVAIGTSFF